MIVGGHPVECRWAEMHYTGWVGEGALQSMQSLLCVEVIYKKCGSDLQKWKCVEVTYRIALQHFPFDFACGKLAGKVPNGNPMITGL